MRGGRTASSSSGEEDGDADWRAAIDSVAVVDVSIPSANGINKATIDSNDSSEEDSNQKKKATKPALKLYQIKAQKILDDLVGKSLEMVRNPIPSSDADPKSGEGGIRLFSKAPPGIQLHPIDAHPQLKRPRIIPREEIDEKSKKFKRQLRSVAVDGVDIMAAAGKAWQRSLARFEAKDAAAKAAIKREEERVAELKKVRGEKWLPSIAREMQVSFLSR